VVFPSIGAVLLVPLRVLATSIIPFVAAAPVFAVQIPLLFSVPIELFVLSIGMPSLASIGACCWSRATPIAEHLLMPQPLDPSFLAFSKQARWAPLRKWRPPFWLRLDLLVFLPVPSLRAL
jgi:hypothetical protein